MGKLFIGYGKPLKHTPSVRQARICRKSNLPVGIPANLPAGRYSCYALLVCMWVFESAQCVAERVVRRGTGCNPQVWVPVWNAECQPIPYLFGTATKPVGMWLCSMGTRFLIWAYYGIFQWVTCGLPATCRYCPSKSQPVPLQAVPEEVPV